MRKITRILTIILVLILALSSLFVLSSCKKEFQDIAIIYTNDVHVGLDEKLGYASLVSMRNELKSEGYATLLVDCGDAIQGGTYGILSKGKAIIEIMNYVGYDVSAVGNHEFDYGIPNFMDIVNMANFEYICCNFQDLKTGEFVFKPYKIYEIGGRKIAFVGIATPETIIQSTPTIFRDESGEFAYGFLGGYDPQKFYDKAQESVDNARKEGADYVIAVAHLGTKETSAPYRSIDLIENTSGIDAVLDGHQHLVVEKGIYQNTKGEDVILTQTGTKFQNIGKLTITKDGNIDTVLISDYEAKDEKTVEFINNIKARYDEGLKEVIGHTDFELSINDETGKRMVRTYETGIGDFVADAYRFVTGAEIAFVNGGGIRTGIKSGDIAYGQLMDVHPYGNKVVVAKIRGSEIADMLEFSVREYPNEKGGFLQVSGISFMVNEGTGSKVKVDEDGMFVEVGEGERRVSSIKVGNKELDYDRLYTVCSTEYLLLNNGDGYVVNNEGLVKIDEMTDLDVLVKYLKENLKGEIPEQYRNVDESRIMYFVACE